MINNKNLQAIKTLADKIEYTLVSVKKEARISPLYDGFAYDMYKEDLCELYGSIKNDIIAIYNHNTRDYYNIFTGKTNTQINNTIDLLRCKLTKKEVAKVIEHYSDLDSEDNLCIEFEDDTTEKQKATIKKKILDNIVINKVVARGYSQGDYEKYTVISYKDISKENNNTLNLIIENLSYFFTIQEYSIELVHIETRLYTSGIEEVEEVGGDSYCTVSYDGYLEEDQLIKDGYTIINNY